MSKRKEYENFLKSYEWKGQRAETLDRSSGFVSIAVMLQLMPIT